MSDLAGKLDIRLDARTGAVSISSSRPVTATRVFAGKPPAEVVRRLPTLFSLCATAQAVACVGACEQALGRKPSAAVLARRQALVQAETIKEHLWRLLLDWPKMLAPAAEPATDIDANAKARAPLVAGTAASAMPRVMRAFMVLRQAQQVAGDPFALEPQQAERGAAAELDPRVLLALVREQVLGAAPADWLDAVAGSAVETEAVVHREALQRWAEHAQTPAAGLVRALVEQGLAEVGANAAVRLPSAPWRQLARLMASANADAFIAAPQWQHACAETGPLARVAAQPLIAALLTEQGNGLLTRLAALLVDLAQSARRLDMLLGTPVPDPVPDRPNAAHPSGACAEDSEQGVDQRSGRDSEIALSQCLGRVAALADSSESGAARPGLAPAAGNEDARLGPGQDSGGSDGAGAGIGMGMGIGLADAARGLLVHRVRIADGRVQQYQILAPTEWNFHPQGVVAQGLAAIARSGREGPALERAARLYITAVDPCVDYQLSVS